MDLYAHAGTDPPATNSDFSAVSLGTEISVTKQSVRSPFAVDVHLSTSHPLVCLNFKVPLRVRQQFKICAARHNVTMTDLLMLLLEDLAAHPSAIHKLLMPEGKCHVSTSKKRSRYRADDTGMNSESSS
jgi:hypothetical protein